MGSSEAVAALDRLPEDARAIAPQNAREATSRLAVQNRFGQDRLDLTLESDPYQSRSNYVLAEALLKPVGIATLQELVPNYVSKLFVPP